MENSQIENNKDQLLPTPTKKSFLSSLSKRQKISLATLSFFVALVPLGTSAALLTTRLNSRAYLPATPPTPPITMTPTPSASPSATPIICSNPVKNLKNLIPCASDPNGRNNGYMGVLITCQNNYTETYKFKVCTSASDIQNTANIVCKKRSNCPTPTIANNPPTIRTNNLPAATIGRSYNANIVITDQDSKDTITATTSQLPNNLKFTCKGKDERNNHICQISGVPRQAGNFNIQVTAKDNKGATTTKKLVLSVQRTVREQRN